MSATRGVLAIVVAATLAVAALDGMTSWVSRHDEGPVLTEATRLARGELPYRDFDAPYGPLEASTIAATIPAVGPQLLTLRLLRAAGAALLALALGALVLPLAGPARALLVVAAAAWTWPGVLHPGHGALAAQAALAAWALRGEDGAGRRRRLAVAGLAAALTALLRYDLGALACAATAAGIAVQRAPGPGDARARVRAALGDLAPVALAALPAALVYAGLALAAGPARLSGLLEHMRAAVEARRLPWALVLPDLDPLRGVALPWLGPLALLVGLGAAASLARRARRERVVEDLLPALAHALALLLGLVLYARSRPDHPHLFPAFAVGAATLALALPRARTAPAPSRLVVAAAALLLALALGARVAAAADRWRRTVPAALPGLAGVRLLPRQREELALALRAVERLVPPGEPFFVGCQRHDLITWNDALLYALAGRPVPTRWISFNPGFTTTEPVQRRLIEELEARRVRVAFLRWGTWWPEPNVSVVPGSTLLDEWLARHFRRESFVHVDGAVAYVVLVRR